MKNFCSLLMVLALLPLAVWAYPLAIHGGQLIEVRREVKSVPHKDMTKLLTAGKLAPDVDTSGIDEDWKDLPPELGNAFIVVTVQMSVGRISRFDYELKAGDKRYPCKAVSVAGRSFDPRQVNPVGANKDEVRLLFEVPDNLKTFEMVSAYCGKDSKPVLPLKPISISVAD
jgi:hypothetical protein